MRKFLIILFFLISAVSATVAGVISSDADGFGIFVHFSFVAAILVILSIASFFSGCMLLLQDRKVFRTSDDLSHEVKKTFNSPKNSVWEWAFLLNNVIAAFIIFFLFIGAIGGANTNTLGAMFFGVVLQMAVGLVLMLAFIAKQEKNFAVFFPGLALFSMESALIVTIIFLGKSVLQV